MGAMTDALKKPAPDMTISKDDVIEYIKNHPNDPEIFEAFLPEKKRGKRGQPADFQAYMIERLKSDKQNVLESTREIVENSRANMNNQQRIHKAVLRLLEATSFEDFIHCITMDLASILDVDIAVLVVEADGQNIPHIQTNGIRIIPEGTTDRWMHEKSVLLQDNISGSEAIYGGGATLVQSQILLRVDISMDTPPAILAFGSRDPNMFGEGQATDQIIFLARVIERSFRSWLNLPI